MSSSNGSNGSAGSGRPGRPGRRDPVPASDPQPAGGSAGLFLPDLHRPLVDKAEKVARFDAIYARVSGDEQRDRGTIATQIECGKFYAAARQLGDPVVYADDGVSGTIPFAEREAGARLLREAKSGRLRTLISYKIDRLGRRMLDVLQTINQFQQLGVNVVSVNENFDTSTPFGRAALGIVAVFAELERETLLQRTQDGITRTARNNTFMGACPPYGYRKIGKGPTSELVIDDDPFDGWERRVIAGDPLPQHPWSPAGVMRRIFRWLSTGAGGAAPATPATPALSQKSCHEIARYLTELGVPPPAAVNRPGMKGTLGVWQARTIARFAHNRGYMGSPRYGRQVPSSQREVVVEQTYPPLVTPEEWEGALAAVTANGQLMGRAPMHDCLLRSLIRCGICESPYYVLHSGKDHRLYYVCGRRYGKHPGHARCNNANVPGQALEEFVFGRCCHYIHHPGEVLAELELQQRGQAGDLEKIEGELARWTGAKAAIEEQRDEVVELRAKKLIDDTDMVRRRAKLLKEEAFIEEQIEQWRAKRQEQTSAAGQREAVEARLRHLHEFAQELDGDGEVEYALRQEIVRSLVKRIVIRTDEAGRTEATIHWAFDNGAGKYLEVGPTSSSSAHFPDIPTPPLPPLTLSHSLLLHRGQWLPLPAGSAAGSAAAA